MPPRKRPRHDSDLASAYRALAGLGLSAAQCTQVCDILKANPELVDEAAPTRMRMLRILADACQPFVLTESMQLTDGSNFNLDYLCPANIIGALVDYNADVSLAMADAFRGRQFVTLTLVVTSDETFSGNPLHEAGRKFWALSFSFAEFGSRRLTQSVFWWTPLVVRSKKLKLIPGGASRLFALCLQQMMFNEIDGLCCAGLPLTVDGRSCVLFCRFGAAFGDGDALKILLEWKGGGGLRPCFKCSNMWLAGSDIARRKAGDEEITVTRKSAFQLRTSASLTSDLADLLEARRLFQSRRLTKGKYTDLRKVLGFEPSEHGVWTFPRVIAALKLPDSMLFDWAHSAIQDGMFQAIFSAYFQEVQDGELDSVKAFLHGWTWVEGNNRGGVAKLLDIFAGGSWHGHSRPSATDCLVAIVVLRCWLVLGGVDLGRAGKNILLFTDLVSAIQSAKFSGTETEGVADLLDTMWEQWATDFMAFCPVLWKPKGHWLGHLGDQWRYFRMFLDTWVTERLGRRVKDTTSKTRNTRAFERTAVSGFFVAHCEANAHWDCLLSCEVGSAFSARCSSMGRTISCGSWVRHRESLAIGKVALCLLLDGRVSLYVAMRDIVPTPRFAQSPFWSFASSEPGGCELRDAVHVEIPLGLKQEIGYTVLLSSP